MNNNQMNCENRLKREAAYHDTIFSDGMRQRLDKYYSITKYSKKVYKDFVLKDISGKNVLEYGCGTGSCVYDIAKNLGQVTAIDISPVAIKMALEEAVEYGVVDQANFYVMNAENLTFEDQSFDRVCGSGILHHLNLDASYKEIFRVLKQGGDAIFFEPLGHNPIINLYRKLTPQMRTDDEHPLLERDISNAKKYFNSVNVTYFHISSLLIFPLRNTPFFETIYKFTERLDRICMRFVPSLRKFAWIVVIVLKK